MISEFRDEYYFLNDFYPAPLTLPDGRVAPTLGHAFQAYKCVLDEDYLRVLAAPSPRVAKELGQQVRCRDDWAAAKLGVMRRLLALKFATGTPLALALINTGTVLLRNGNTWGGRFWGVCDGRGENWLGHLLMARRAELLGEWVDAQELVE